MNRIDRFLKLMNDRGASDLHLSVGRPPIFRLSGRMEPIRYRVLDDRDFEGFLKPISPPHLWELYQKEGDADYAYEVPGLARFRVNLFKQQRGMGAVFRIIPTKLLTIEQLGLPPSVKKLTTLEGGLVLVTGPTGSGKSTTLSAIIHEMNLTRAMHFVTIEDPIEFVHQNQKSLVSQREIGPHSKSFSSALRAAVREDPDCILVGEMRDLETIEAALVISETGHVAFGTLHTNSCVQTINRVLDVFPPYQQPQVRAQLSFVLEGVMSQALIPKQGAPGRVLALEVMVPNPAIRNLIREDKVHQIYSQMQVGQQKFGMQTFNQSLFSLVQRRIISVEEAFGRSSDPEELRNMMGGMAANVRAPPPGTR